MPWLISSIAPPASGRRTQQNRPVTMPGSHLATAPDRQGPCPVAAIAHCRSATETANRVSLQGSQSRMDHCAENAKAPDRLESMKDNKKLLMWAKNKDIIMKLNKTLHIAQLKFCNCYIL